MQDGGSLEVAGSHVISETIDGETVVIHLESGIYYSLGGTASEIWESIVDGTSQSALVAGLCARYEAAPGAVEEAVRAFLDEIEQDGLIRRLPGPPRASADAVAAAEERPPFATPTVQRFTDIQELLMLDPIHEVDPTGWPRRGSDA